MRAILIIAGLILAMCLFSALAPTLIAVMIGAMFISDGMHVIGGAIIIFGIITNIAMWHEIFDGAVNPSAGAGHDGFTDQTDLYEEDEIYEEQKRAEDEDAAAFIGLLSHLDHKDD